MGYCQEDGGTLPMVRTMCALVIEDNPDHQLLIGYSFRASIPQAEPVFASSAAEARTYLQQSHIQKKCFPRFVLLDLYLPQIELGWQLLKEIRAAYPALPIIVLSAYDNKACVQQAYTLGAHSFIVKPSSLPEWEACFEQFGSYWLKTVTLPPTFR